MDNQVIKTEIFRIFNELICKNTFIPRLIHSIGLYRC